MKVLLINNFYYRKGGSETVFFNTARLLEQAGHHVCFFSVAREENISSPFSKYFISDISNASKVKGLLSYFYNKEAATKLEKLILTEKPDIAHSHLMWGCTAPAIFKVLKKYKIPLVHTVHDYRMICPAYTFTSGGSICEECKGKHFYKCATKRCSKGSLLMSTVMTAEMYFRNAFYNPTKNIQGLIYVSNFAKNIHEKYASGFKKVPSIVLYNCTQKQVGEEKVRNDYYLYYGRLSHEKGVEMLIEAFKQLPQTKLKIVGTGPIENDLIQDAKGTNNIEFLGFKTGDELHQLVQGAQFVIVPSQWYENNPMTIVESYSFGTPVIGSDLGGIPEIIEDGKTGYIFNHCNLESLITSIKQSEGGDDEDYKQMSERAASFYKTNFSEDNYADKLVDFYNSVLNKK